MNAGIHDSVRSQTSTRGSEVTASNPPSTPRPTVAPKITIDIKHIRQNAALHERNCRERRYEALAGYSHRINELYEGWRACQSEARGLRERNNLVKMGIAGGGRKKMSGQELGQREGEIDGKSREELIVEARRLKEALGEIEKREGELIARIEDMAVALPNLTSEETPMGDIPTVVGYINEHPDSKSTSQVGVDQRAYRSHVDIGLRLGILDFASAATTTGWGWYYLLNEGAMLEQALIQYALSVARKRAWQLVTPPSMVYSHIASACGFQPRDQNGEGQIYAIQQSADDVARGKPELCLAGTAEIPLAGMRANTTMDEAAFPVKKVGVSRSYRAEAGARGADTKGLYRVHEFTKVELFAWTLPSAGSSGAVFEEMQALQVEILTALGLHCRILEMPSTDLGASATRKRDIEAFFPGRREVDEGWGEVTSVSTCTDYQSRRLATRLRMGSGGGKLEWPWTVNGTALAVPRVLAAVLESGWSEDGDGKGVVKVPECLWPWTDGVREIREV